MGGWGSAGSSPHWHGRLERPPVHRVDDVRTRLHDERRLLAAELLLQVLVCERYRVRRRQREQATNPASLINTYSLWGLANAINAIVLLLQWVPTALVWVATILNIDELTWFYVMWCGVMHYVDAVRFLLVAAIKTASFWADRETDVTSYSGLQATYKVSKEHQASYWDFAVEWLGFVVSFGFYMDLHSVINKMPFVIAEREKKELEKKAKK